LKLQILKVKPVHIISFLFLWFWSWDYFIADMACKGINKFLNIQIGDSRTHNCTIETFVQIFDFIKFQIDFHDLFGFYNASNSHALK